MYLVLRHDCRFMIGHSLGRIDHHCRFMIGHSLAIMDISYVLPTFLFTSVRFASQACPSIHIPCNIGNVVRMHNVMRYDCEPQKTYTNPSRSPTARDWEQAFASCTRRASSSPLATAPVSRCYAHPRACRTSPFSSMFALFFTTFPFIWVALASHVCSSMQIPYSIGNVARIDKCVRHNCFTCLFFHENTVQYRTWCPN